VESVSLRRIADADWARIHEWASSEEACRYQTWGPNEPDDTKRFVADAIAAWADDSQARRVWVAEVEELGVIGLGELKVNSVLHRQAEIAYAVHVDFWGRGFGAAVAKALMDVALAEGMHRVFGTCDPRNKASGRVLQKVGMRYEGTLRHTLNIRDGWRDSDIYALIAGDT
jgi:RimJ/RimL family protein N-acetyltransferase